ECELRGQMLVRLDRVAAPLRAGRPRADVVAGAEAAALGAQQDDAGRRLLVGPGKGTEPLLHQLGADRVELVRPVQRDDAGLIVDLVEHHGFGHDRLLLAASATVRYDLTRQWPRKPLCCVAWGLSDPKRRSALQAGPAARSHSG